jgi:hypothetical protein
VLDPFAGGSARGIVASRLGGRYIGIELRAEQVAANVAQLHLAGEAFSDNESLSQMLVDAFAGQD